MPVNKGGWIFNPREIDKVKSELQYPFLSQAGPQLVSSGAGKTALLHEVFTKLRLKFPINDQKIGDCVSHASACACNVLRAVEISLGDNQKWIAETSTEDIYYGSRVIIGGNQIQGDGSIGAWAVKYMQRSSNGTLFRIKYDFADLSVYSGDRAKAWGSNRNVPSGLAQEAKKTPIDAYTACKNYEEVRDALANGYPVIVCSQQGFSQTRDAEGFAKPEGTWAHAMCFIAMDDKFKRPGVLCMNSWGPNWISGSKRHNQPDGSFWVDADIVNKMCKMGDTWAISGFNGFKKKPKMRII